MRTDELDYELPTELIAQTPLEPRDASRLLVVSGRGAGLRLADAGFADLAGLLEPGDVLVRNDTRVVPARTRFRRATGARIEVLFLEPVHDRDRAAVRADDVEPVRAAEWEALVRGRPREGETLVSEAGGDEFRVELRRRLGDGRWRVACLGDEPPARLLARFGETPLPPYIRADLDDADRYQTVYAAADGSAAAPTAGLHFTAAADAALRARGIAIEQLTLHVGLATFKPVTADDLEDHPLHDEPFIVREDVWRRIDDAAADGRRVVAVGTTMVRLLEELRRRQRDGGLDWVDGALRGRTGLFLTPGFEFALVSGMLTNFHLPRTSLLALVMAFCGVEETRRVYSHAIAARYRFYSFGDAMLALPDGATGRDRTAAS